MIQAFLRAKHWQLFILLFGIPMIAQFLFMGFIFSNIAAQEIPDTALIENYFIFFPIIMLIFMSIYYGWFWSVSVGLQKNIPPDLRLKIGRFKILLLIPFFYIIIFFALFLNLFSAIQSEKLPDIFNYFVLIVPFHLFSMFCMFYIMYFTAKTIKTAELQRTVKFDDFIGEFFMIWFFPVGVWILQPKINKINAESNIQEELV